MTFDEWYASRIGITPAEAEKRGVWDMQFARDCWEAATLAERKACVETCEMMAKVTMEAATGLRATVGHRVATACAAAIRAR